MTEEMKREALQNIIDMLDESDIISMWNERCDNTCYDDEYIYSMGDFDELMNGKSPSDIVDALDSNFDLGDDYIRFTIWGVESFSDIYDIVDDGELIDYMLENDEDFYNSDIREVLEEEDEDEEDEEEETA